VEGGGGMVTKEKSGWDGQLGKKCGKAHYIPQVRGSRRNWNKFATEYFEMEKHNSVEATVKGVAIRSKGDCKDEDQTS